MPNLKCKICGTEFPALIERHYISRDLTKTGIVAAFNSTDEPTLYDTYDCPNCGCQVIVQPRKRRFDQKIEEATDEELLENMDSKTISDHLGLDSKVVDFLRSAKENDVPVISKTMSEKDIYNFMNNNDLTPSEVAEKLDIPREKVIRAIDEVALKPNKPSSLYFDNLETAGDKLYLIREYLEKKGFISIGEVSQILGEKHNLASKWGWIDLRQARIVQSGKNRYYISFPGICNRPIPKEET